MAKIYVQSLRRGWKETDANGNVTRNDWEEYESMPDHWKPIEGELVLEYDNGIPRLKIGDGIHEFSELSYMSIDSFILPKQAFVELSTSWTEEQKNGKTRYYQEVKVSNATITLNSKVDLQPTAEQLYTFHQKDLAFVAENDGGKIRVYCVGLVPQNGYTIPATVTEVVAEDESTIVGNTTATPNPQPDWNQDDATKADYIKNKPKFVAGENGFSGSYNDLTDKPTNVSAFINDAGYLTTVPNEIYVGDGEMPEDATIQIIMDGVDEEQALKDELMEYIDTELENSNTDILEQIAQLSSEKVVLYSPQTLTDAEKAQARANLGIVDDDVPYTNLAEPLPDNTTDTTKWVNGYRISSTGIAASSGTTLSNPIHCNIGDVVRVKGVNFREGSDRFSVWINETFDDGTKMDGNCTGHVSVGSTNWVSVTKIDDNEYEFKVIKLSSSLVTLDYMRFAFETPTNPSNVIITVNEEIVNNDDMRIDDLETRTTALENRVTTLENMDYEGGTTSDVSTIPAYWESHLAEKISEVKALQDEGGKDCFSFIVMADTHYPSNLGKKSPILAKHILDKCDIRYALLLGDAQTRGCYNTKELLLAENAQIEEMLSPIRDRLLQTEGNHDGSYGWLDRDGDGKYDNTDKEPAERETYVYNLTPAELHSAIYRKVGLVGDVHFDESGSGYYVDDTANKVRYIILNTQCNDYELQEDGTSKYPKMWLMNFTQSQFDLVIEALNDIPSDSWGVVVAGHCPLFQEIGDRVVMQGVLGAYARKTSYSDTYDGKASGDVSYANLADVDSADWLKNTRYNSSYVQTVAPGVDVTNYIAISDNSLMHLKDFDIMSNLQDGANYGRIYFYDENKNYIGYQNPSAIASVRDTWFTTADYNDAVMLVNIADIVYYYENIRGKAKYIRFGGIPGVDIIITDNEEIQYVDGYTNLAEPLPDNTTDTTKWVNGYRLSSSGLAARADTTVSNSISCKYGDVIRIKGVTLRENDDRICVTFYQNGGEVDDLQYWNVGNTFTCELIDDVYVVTIQNVNAMRLRFAMPTPTNPDAIIVTRNQEIIGNEVAGVPTGKGYDYVSVDCDFSNAKGQLIGYFHGHTHIDSVNNSNNFKIIGTRCDAKEENVEALWNERVAGTITEQSFDVFTVNKKTRKIYATKIGAGDNREISY